MKKVCFLLVTFLLIISIAETSLYILANAFEYYQTTPQSDKSTKILILGESTSVDYLGEKSWPVHLQEIFDKKRKNVSIINKSRAGTNTFEIKKSLRHYLKTYNPKIVITMMGINDQSPYNLNLFEKKNLIYYIKKLRTFKILNEIMNNIDPYIVPNRVHFNHKKNHLLCISHEHAKAKYPIEIETKLMRLLEDKKFSQLEKLISAHSKDTHEQAIQMAYLAMKYSRENEFDTEHSDILLKMIEYSFEREENILGLNDLYLYHLYKTKQYDKCLDSISKLKKNNKTYTYTYLRRLNECYAKSNIKNKDIIWDNLINELGYKYNLITHLDNFTRNNYRKMSKILYYRGVDHIAVQYPLMPLSKLEDYFEEYKYTPDIFISNKENFKQAISDENYDNIFTDRFARKFGHLTTEGHSILAKRIAKDLLKHGYID